VFAASADTVGVIVCVVLAKLRVESPGRGHGDAGVETSQRHARQLPKDFAPWPTVYWYFTWWHDDGTVQRIHGTLLCQIRQADGRNAEPSAGLIDSQSVRTAETVPAVTRASIRS
jgi:hypothetical protein